MLENTLQIPVTVKDGWINLCDADKRLIQAWARNREGKRVTLRLSPHSKPRSNRQNRYLWGVVYSYIAAYTGHSTEDLHAVLRDQFLERRFIELAGKEVEVRKSTAELSASEFTAYVERIVAWSATELGLAIPLPE